MKKKNANKLYIVRKYILASSAEAALKKERRIRPDDVWVDDEWKKNNREELPSAIGFHDSPPYGEEDDE